MDSAVKRLQQVHVSVIYHDKYIEKFDAMSLATVDLTQPIDPQRRDIELRGFQLLIRELTSILNEGSISSQTAILGILSDIQQREEKSQQTSQHRKLDPTLTLERIDDPNSSNNDEVQHIHKSIASSQETVSELLFQKDFQSQLIHLYKILFEVGEQKVIMLRLLLEIIEHFKEKMIEIAQQTRILNASEKAHSLIQPNMTLLTQHKLFIMAEVKVHLLFLVIFLAYKSMKIIIGRRFETSHCCIMGTSNIRCFSSLFIS
jgi:hypothetical protein